MGAKQKGEFGWGLSFSNMAWQERHIKQCCLTMSKGRLLSALLRCQDLPYAFSFEWTGLLERNRQGPRCFAGFLGQQR
eukprot:5087608-Amphidinium_carterae.1